MISWNRRYLGKLFTDNNNEYDDNWKSWLCIIHKFHSQTCLIIINDEKRWADFLETITYTFQNSLINRNSKRRAFIWNINILWHYKYKYLQSIFISHLKMAKYQLIHLPGQFFSTNYDIPSNSALWNHESAWNVTKVYRLSCVSRVAKQLATAKSNTKHSFFWSIVGGQDQFFGWLFNNDCWTRVSHIVIRTILDCILLLYGVKISESQSSVR